MLDCNDEALMNKMHYVIGILSKDQISDLTRQWREYKHIQTEVPSVNELAIFVIEVLGWR